MIVYLEAKIVSKAMEKIEYLDKVRYLCTDTFRCASRTLGDAVRVSKINTQIVQLTLAANSLDVTDQYLHRFIYVNSNPYCKTSYQLKNIVYAKSILPRPEPVLDL